MISIEEMDEKVVDPECIILEEKYLEALDGINVEENEKAILQAKDPAWCFLFVENVSDKNLKDHENVILESKDEYWIYEFAMHIPGADVQKHIDFLKLNPENINSVKKLEQK